MKIYASPGSTLSGNQHYHHYFQEPGLAEAEFDADIAKSLRSIHHAISGDAKGAMRWRLFVMPGETALDTMPDPGATPHWLQSDSGASFS